MFRYLVFVLISIPGMLRAKEPQMKLVEKFSYDWNQDGIKEEFIFELPKKWNDPGNYTKLTIRRQGKVIFSLEDLQGVQPSINKVPGASGRNPGLKKTPHNMAFQDISYDPAKPRILAFLNNWKGGSSFDDVIILDFDEKTKKIRVLFNDEMGPKFFSGRDRNGLMMLYAQSTYGQCSDTRMHFCTYTPELVYYVNQEKGALVVDEEESRNYNESRNYPWMGPRPRGDLYVYTPPRRIIHQAEVERLSKEIYNK